MKFLSLDDVTKMLTDRIDSHGMGIIKTIDFQWGTLFYTQTKNFIKTGDFQDFSYGVCPYLVDKVNGSIHTIPDGKIIDIQLEEYRKNQGYPHVIKFPLKKDLTQLNDLDKVFAFMGTSEIVQIEKAIEIVKEKKLFNIEGLGKLCFNDGSYSLAEAIAGSFNSFGSEQFFYESTLKTIPDEITLFKDKITGLMISRSQIEMLPKSILELVNLTYISVEATPLREMPFDLSCLVKLEKVYLHRTEIKPEYHRKFKLPKGCKLEIIT